MAYFGFTYAGTHSSEFGIKVLNIERYPLPTLSRQTVDVPSVPGVINAGTSIQENVFAVTIKLVDNTSIEDLADTINMIAAWLKPIANDQPLIFDDQPDVTWYASVSSTEAYTRALFSGQAKITFSCADPKGYKPEKLYNIDNTNGTVTDNDTGQTNNDLVTTDENGASVTLQAQASQMDNHPIYRLRAGSNAQPITHVMLDLHNKTDDGEGGQYSDDSAVGFVTVGSDSATGQDSTDKEPYLVNDPCNTLAPWKTYKNGDAMTFELGSNIELGVGASLQSYPNTITLGWTDVSKGDGSSTKFKMLSYGDNSDGNFRKKWHGPGMLYTPFTSSTKDFQVDVRFNFEQSWGMAKSQIFCSLLDINGHEIARMGLKDNSDDEGLKPFASVGAVSGSHHSFSISAGKTKKGKSDTKAKTYKVYAKDTKKESESTVQTYTTKKKTTKKGKKKVTKTVKVKGKKKTVIHWKTLTIDSNDSSNTYTRFYGTFSLRKVGTKWTLKISKLDSSGRAKTIYSRSYTDTANNYSDHLLQNCFVYFGKWDTPYDHNPRKKYTENRPRICDLKVKQIIDGGNMATAEPTPVMKAGDELVIDTEGGSVYKNGKPFEAQVGTSSDVTGLSLQGANPYTLVLDPPPVNSSDYHWQIQHRDTLL